LIGRFIAVNNAFCRQFVQQAYGLPKGLFRFFFIFLFEHVFNERAHHGFVMPIPLPLLCAGANSLDRVFVMGHVFSIRKRLVSNLLLSQSASNIKNHYPVVKKNFIKQTKLFFLTFKLFYGKIMFHILLRMLFQWPRLSQSRLSMGLIR